MIKESYYFIRSFRENTFGTKNESDVNMFEIKVEKDGEQLVFYIIIEPIGA